MIDNISASHKRFDRGVFYRRVRTLHAYASALAFGALLFFSLTGVLLNHPEWYDGYRPRETKNIVTLAAEELTFVKTAPDQGRRLAAIIAARIPLPGSFSSSEVLDNQIVIRMDGPKGTADVNLNLGTGRAEVRSSYASLSSLMIDLHRGKNSGDAWRVLIDVSAWLVVTLSVLGLILFFSLRFRLVSSLIFMTTGIAAMLGLVAWLVP